MGTKPELNNLQQSLNEQEVNLFKEVLDPINQEPENEPPSKQTPTFKNESVVENAPTAAEDSTSSKIDTQEDNVTKEDDAQVDKNKRAEETSQTIVDAEKSPNAELGSVKSPEEQKDADVESRFVDEAQRISEQSKMEGENESKHETEATAEMTSTEI